MAAPRGVGHAGVVLDGSGHVYRCAPILGYMRGWSREPVLRYARIRRWTASSCDEISLLAGIARAARGHSSERRRANRLAPLPKENRHEASIPDRPRT